MRAPARAPEAQRARVRPVRAGCSFGLRQRVGTLGLVVFDERTAAPLLLSSSHVLNRHADGRVYPLFQPAGQDAHAGDAPFAHAFRFTRLDRRGVNRTEGGLARPASDEVDPTHPLVGRVRRVRLPEPGLRLWKVGRTTGTVSGVVADVAWAGPIRVQGRWFPFAGQVLVRTGDGEPISLLGDSGSVWVTEAGEAVAMNIAGDDGGRSSIATPMGPLLSRLGATLSPGGAT